MGTPLFSFLKQFESSPLLFLVWFACPLYFFVFSDPLVKALGRVSFDRFDSLFRFFSVLFCWEPDPEEFPSGPPFRFVLVLVLLPYFFSIVLFSHWD